MSQVFGGDAVNSTIGVTLNLNTETTVLTGNFLNPPFGNAKAYVSAMVGITVGASATGMQLRLRRNINGENTIIVGTSTITVAGGNFVHLSISWADAIPDGRPVQYSITVQQVGAAGNGTAGYANIGALLISG